MIRRLRGAVAGATTCLTGLLALGAALAPLTPAMAKEGFLSREEVIEYTPEWTGERFADGRPKVSDDLIERMRAVTLEEAWATLRSAGLQPSV